ncbi:MAG: hypothetical protein HYT87_08460 [Nitrospirae bacterium]|nr:hypothetical protein [Nitrospirota bacterium]
MSFAVAAPTKLLSYQGRITDANGQPITDNPYTVRFKIYSTSADCTGDTAGNLVWGPETHDGAAGNWPQVTVTNGLFSTILGYDSVQAKGTALSIAFDQDYYLQVKVGANPVFNPCDRLTTAPYAANAINSDSCNTDATCETTAVQIVDANTRIVEGAGNSVRIQTDSGYVDIGPQNTSWSHFQTDRTQFYFNKQVGVDGNLFPYTDNTRDLGGSSNRWATVYSNEVGWGDSQTRTQTRDDAGAMGGKSGFYQTSAPAPAADWPSGAASWWHLLDVRHSNTANNYGMQFSGSFFDQNLYFRKTNNSASTAWKQVAMTDGTVADALACSADTVCETQAITATGYIASNNCVGGGGTTGTAGTQGNTWRMCNAGAANNWIYVYNGAGTAYHDVALGQLWVSGTQYATGQVYARSGIANDTASAKLSLNDADGVTVGGPLDTTSTITTPGYVSITGVSDASGNLRFSAANPYISASSYFVAPGGAYFNSGTVYVQNALMARNYIQNDDTPNGGRVRIDDTTDITGGAGGLRLGAANWDDGGTTYGHIVADNSGYKALMIVGNNITGNSGWGREVKVWDYLNVQGSVNITSYLTRSACPSGWVNRGNTLCVEDSESCSKSLSGAANYCKTRGQNGSHLCTNGEIRQAMQQTTTIGGGWAQDYMSDQSDDNQCAYVNSDTNTVDIDGEDGDCNDTDRCARCCINLE